MDLTRAFANIFVVPKTSINLSVEPHPRPAMCVAFGQNTFSSRERKNRMRVIRYNYKSKQNELRMSHFRKILRETVCLYNGRPMGETPLVYSVNQINCIVDNEQNQQSVSKLSIEKKQINDYEQYLINQGTAIYEQLVEGIEAEISTGTIQELRQTYGLEPDGFKVREKSNYENQLNSTFVAEEIAKIRKNPEERCYCEEVRFGQETGKLIAKKGETLQGLENVKLLFSAAEFCFQVQTHILNPFKGNGNHFNHLFTNVALPPFLHKGEIKELNQKLLQKDKISLDGFINRTPGMSDYNGIDQHNRRVESQILLYAIFIKNYKKRLFLILLSLIAVLIFLQEKTMIRVVQILLEGIESV